MLIFLGFVLDLFSKLTTPGCLTFNVKCILPFYSNWIHSFATCTSEYMNETCTHTRLFMAATAQAWAPKFVFFQVTITAVSGHLEPNPLSFRHETELVHHGLYTYAVVVFLLFMRRRSIKEEAITPACYDYTWFLCCEPLVLYKLYIWDETLGIAFNLFGMFILSNGTVPTPSLSYPRRCCRRMAAPMRSPCMYGFILINRSEIFKHIRETLCKQGLDHLRETGLEQKQTVLLRKRLTIIHLFQRVWLFGPHFRR